MKNRYDLIIAGGGTAGVSCAYIAAKLGLEVLIIEKNSYLGGTITSSLVVPAMKTSDNAINTDFFNELYKNLEQINGAITYCDGNKGWFNPELTKIALDKMMTEAGVEVLFESFINNIYTNNTKVLSISIDTISSHNNLLYNNIILSNPIETRYLIDATGDAKICQKLNCEFLNNNSETQPTSLRFIMSGVNVEEFSSWIMELDKDRDVTTSCKIDGNTYCSTAYTWDSTKWALKPIVEQAISDNVVEAADLNYFQLFSVAGTQDSIAFNAPRLLANDGYILARERVLRLSRFCNKYLKGFEKAYISSIANSIGVRVSKRVKGKYVYKIEDLLTSKVFDNPVVISNYPVDIHSKEKDSSTLQKVYKEYQLPLESLQAEGFDNLYVIGRCISADFKSQAALRIIPSCFSMGEGLAKYLAKK